MSKQSYVFRLGVSEDMLKEVLLDEGFRVLWDLFEYLVDEVDIDDLLVVFDKCLELL